MTKYFQSKNGVRQGDCLSPTFFGIFINDIAEVINNCGAGIPINEGSVSILMYADDIALLVKLLTVFRNSQMPFINGVLIGE